MVKVECGARLIQVPGMKNQNTGVNILYGELSVRICDPIQNSAPRIPLVFDFYSSCRDVCEMDRACMEAERDVRSVT